MAGVVWDLIKQRWKNRKGGGEMKERALIGTDATGGPIILATDGATVAFDCEEVSTNAEDIGLGRSKDFTEAGLYLWEGTAKMESGGAPWEPGEPEVVYTGTIRKVAPEEVAELYAMEPPEPSTPPEDDREQIAEGDYRYYRGEGCDR
jgi:hypothetical protein